MDLAKLKEIIEENGWYIEGDLGNGSGDIDLSQYSPKGENFSFTIQNSSNVDDIIKEIYEYEDEYDPNEHMAMFVDSAGRNGTPDLIELAQDAVDIGKMIENLADAIRDVQTKPIGEIIKQYQDNNTETKEENKLQEDEENADDNETDNSEENELEQLDDEENEALDNIIEEYTDKNPLYKRVIEEIIDDSEDYDGTKLEKIKGRLGDISNGLVNGVVSSLIYYSDTKAFYEEYEDDIYDFIDYLVDNGLEPIEAIKKNRSETEILMHTDTVINDIVWMVYAEIAWQFSEDLENL